MDVVRHTDDEASADELAPEGLDLTPRAPRTSRSGATGQRKWPWFIVLIVIVVGIGFVVSKAISDATLFFYNADEAVQMRDELGDKLFRLQGTVESGTTERTADGVAFKVAFNGVEVVVAHQGDPPDMFSDQIPVVLEGHWAVADGEPVFDSDFMLVKHGDTYVAENSDRLEEAAAELRSQAVSMIRHLVVASRLPLLKRQQALRPIRNQVDDVEWLSARIGTSAIEARGSGAVDAGLADIKERLASLEYSRSLLAGE